MFAIAMIVLFLHATTWENHIFEGIKKYIPPNEEGNKWYKAVYGCPICMTPWWGTFFYWLFIGDGVCHWLMIVGGAAGINVISVCFLSLRKMAVEFVKKMK